MITCEQCREEMAEYALGHSEPESAAAMAEHFAACVVCRRELAEVESAWSALPMGLEPVAPREEVFSRVNELIDQAQGAHADVRTAQTERPKPLTRWQLVASYVLAASVLVALIAGSMYVRRAGQGRLGDVAADQALHDLAERLGKVQELEQMLRTGSVKLASLKPRASHGRSTAYVVWDLPNGQWHFYALNLPAAPAGQTYQLWAVAKGQEPIAGPTFDVDAEGMGKTVADFPQLRAAANVTATVTLEPEEGSKSPTGAVVLESPL